MDYEKQLKELENKYLTDRRDFDFKFIDNIKNDSLTEDMIKGLLYVFAMTNNIALALYFLSQADNKEINNLILLSMLAEIFNSNKNTNTDIFSKMKKFRGEE